MNLRFLRTFVAIADNNGVARAAARLNLTQSAASRQIHALETELGVRLFDRIGRSVKLTSQGEDLLVRSRRLLSDAEVTWRAGSRAQVWSYRCVADWWAPPRLWKICLRTSRSVTANVIRA